MEIPDGRIRDLHTSNSGSAGWRRAAASTLGLPRPRNLLAVQCGFETLLAGVDADHDALLVFVFLVTRIGAGLNALRRAASQALVSLDMGAE
jgi:hypothetical protein